MNRRIFYLCSFFFIAFFSNIFARDIVDILIEYEEKQQNERVLGRYAPPIFLAIEKNDEEAVDLLLKHGSNVNDFCYSSINIKLNYPANCYSLLGLAVELRNVNIISALCSYKADPTLIEQKSKNDIRYFTSDSNICKFLRRLNYKNEFHALEWHYSKDLSGYYFKLNLLETYSSYKITPIFEAILSNRIDILKILISTECDLEKPCFIDQGYYFSKTPLQVAMIMGNKEMMNLLLEYGAKIK